MSSFKDNVILFGDRNLEVGKVELAHITKLHNEGKTTKELSKLFNRPEIEIILSLLHQVDMKKIDVRPFAYRKNQVETCEKGAI